MDHFAEMQISSQGNVTHSRKRWVVTPTQAPVEVQHLPHGQSAEIVERMKLNKEVTLQNALKDLRERVGATVALSRKEKADLAWEKAKTHVSVLRWVPALDWSIVKADVIAGLTVGVMVIPQSISYANIAGLQFVYGMYSAFVPTLVYALLGNSRHQVVGPVAIVCLLIKVGLEGRLSEEECPAFYAQEGPALVPQNVLCPYEYAKLAMLLAFLVGVLQLAGGLFDVSFLVSFLGHPVMSGFTSAAAIIIGLSQLKDWLGFPLPQSKYIHVMLGSIFADIRKTNGATLGLGVAWFVALYAMRWAAGKYQRLSVLRAGGEARRRGGARAEGLPRPPRASRPVRRVNSARPPARPRPRARPGPLIMCLIGICMMWSAPYLKDELGIQIVGEIPEGLPPFSGGALRTGKLSSIFAPALSIAVIGYMELIAIGKSLAAKHGYELPAGQELIAVGFANLAGSLCSSFPVSGSFSRSAVNNAVGAKSQLASLITGARGGQAALEALLPLSRSRRLRGAVPRSRGGCRSSSPFPPHPTHTARLTSRPARLPVRAAAVIMFLTLLVLTPAFYYLPKFCLASVVIASVITLVQLSDARELWRVKKADCFLWVFAFFATLFLGVEEGIAAAVGVSLVIVIYESVRPQISILWRLPGTEIYRNVKQENAGEFVRGVLIVRIGASMYFANVAYIRDTLLEYIRQFSATNEVRYVIVEMTAVISIDSTAIHILEGLVKDLRMRKIMLAFTTVGNRVEKVRAEASGPRSAAARLRARQLSRAASASATAPPHPPPRAPPIAILSPLPRRRCAWPSSTS